jgi:hypothetical protein
MKFCKELIRDDDQGVSRRPWSKLRSIGICILHLHNRPHGQLPEGVEVPAWRTGILAQPSGHYKGREAEARGVVAADPSISEALG